MPSLLVDQERHLTKGHGELEAALAKTYAGMAHFAGTGPEGKSCRECAFWSHAGYHPGGIIKPARCSRFTKLTGKRGGEIPHSASACKHFDENPHPPKVTA